MKGIGKEEYINTFQEYLLSYSKKNNKKIKIIFNNTQLEKIEPRARMLVFEFSKNDILSKVAIVGANFALRSLFNLFSSITKLKNMKFLKTEVEAIDWLKKDK